MSRKIGIIGAGNVGATVAMSLTTHNICNEIILVDSNYTKAEAQALDIIDMMPFAQSYTHILATDDPSALADTDIIINCVGAESSFEDRLDELQGTAKIIKEVFPIVMQSGFDGIIINITNPCDVITMLIQEVTGLPTSRVFGTGTALDTSRLYAHIGMTLQVDPSRISGYVLGEHGESQFIAWSTVRIDTFSAEQLIAEMPPGLGFNFEAVEEIVREAGWKVAKGKGHTNFAIAQVATSLVNAVYNNTQTILPLSTYSKEHACYLSSPAMVWKHGIRYATPAVLTEEEQVKLNASATIIKNAFDTVN